MLGTGNSSFKHFYCYALICCFNACQVGCARQGSPPVATLIARLNEGSYEDRMNAFNALRELGADAKAAIPTLVKLLEDDDSRIRSRASDTLGALGPEAELAIPSLILKLNDEHRFVRSASAEALVKIGGKEKRIISAVMHTMFVEPDPCTRIKLAECLADLDPERDEAIAAIIDVLLNCDEPFARLWAAGSLRRINSSGIKTSIPALIIALKDTDADVRSSVAYALGKICEESSEVVPALIDCINDESTRVRVSVAQALGEYGPEAKTAIPALTHALNDPNDRVRARAAQSLRYIKTWQKKRGQKGLDERIKKAEEVMQRTKKR